MKRAISSLSVLSIVVLCATAVAGGQQDSAAASQLAEARALIQESQNTIVREELRLSAAEDAAFWPLYGRYRAALQPIQDRYVDMVVEYMRNYEAGLFSDEYTKRMLDDYFEIKSDMLRERKNFLPQFGEILPTRKVALFYQLENKFFANVDAELALAVPLIETN